MRHHWRLPLVAGHAVGVVEAGDGIRHGVRQMDPGIAEGETCERRREHHGMPGLFVLGIADGAHQVPASQLDGVQAADIAERIGALVGRPEVG